MKINNYSNDPGDDMYPVTCSNCGDTWPQDQMRGLDEDSLCRECYSIAREVKREKEQEEKERLEANSIQQAMQQDDTASAALLAAMQKGAIFTKDMLQQLYPKQ